MKITLSKVKHLKENSEETHCFHAVVCIDGKPSFTASNAGRGGPTMPQPIGKTPAEIRASRIAIESVQAYAKSLPEQTSHYEDDDFTFQPTLETIVDGLLVRHLNAVVLKKEMKHKVLMIENGDLLELTLKAGHKPTPEIIQWAKKQYPQATILNDLPLEQAADMYMEEQ